ncbi:MAG: hypothetical protein Q4F05_03105 [bacterium]|nr:hypothetical protein [bacterium]
MDALLLFLSKYVFGYFLQDVVFIMGIYTFGKEKLDKKTFLLMISVFIPTNIIVKVLPMSYGINILINIAVVLYITYRFCEFELYSIIRSTLTTTLLVLFTEMACVGCLLMLFGKNTADLILQTPVLKASVYIPFNCLLAFFIYLCYRRMISKNY